MGQKIEWTGTKGNALAVEIVEARIGGATRATARAYVDGRRFGDDVLTERSSLRNPPAAVLAVVGQLAITDAGVMAKIRTGIADLQAQIDIRPEVVRSRLAQQRGVLAARIGYIVSAGAEDRERIIERANATGIMRTAKRDYATEHAAATAALAAFDAEHPDVLAEIMAQRADDVARWVQN